MSEPTPPSAAFGRFHFDGDPAKLSLDGRDVVLPPRELHLLGIFLEHPAEWLTEEWLSHGLWPKAVPPTGELDRLIRELTAALDAGADGVATIQSLKGRGHRFLLPVRAIDLPGAKGARPSPPASGAASTASPALPAKGRSAHRRLLAPRQVAIALLGVGALAAALLWVNRPARWRSGAGSTAASDAAAARDPKVVRAAATAEWRRGAAAARQHDLASRRLAMTHFEAASALDPSLAAAHAGLASTLVFEGLTVAGGGEEMESARRSAATALELDEGLADAHAARAFARLFADRSPASARVSAERALVLDATNVGGRRALAWVLAVEGRFLEAVSQLSLTRTGTQFDPEVECDEGAILYLAGRSLEARRQLSEVVRREPIFRRGHATLAALHLRERRLGAAAFELEMLDALAAGATRDDDRVRQRAAGSWAMPEASEAARLLAERAERAVLAPPGAAAGSQLEAARIFAQFGDRERALAALQRALDRRESAAVLARIDPAFVSLRSVAAFREMIDRAGVPVLAQP